MINLVLFIAILLLLTGIKFKQLNYSGKIVTVFCDTVGIEHYSGYIHKPGYLSKKNDWIKKL